jgi:hypothetical protein
MLTPPPSPLSAREVSERLAALHAKGIDKPSLYEVDPELAECVRVQTVLSSAGLAALVVGLVAAVTVAAIAITS